MAVGGDMDDEKGRSSALFSLETRCVIQGNRGTTIYNLSDHYWRILDICEEGLQDGESEANDFEMDESNGD